MIHLTLEGVTVSYPSRELPALSSVSLDVPEGAMLGLIGPNGSGKSTLLRCLYRALRPEEGRVLLLGQDIARFGPRHLAEHVAVACQEEELAVPFTTWEYVLLGRSVRSSVWRSYSAEDRNRVDQALHQFGLGDLRNCPVPELSGGERRRAMLARTLVQDTPVLLLDEPTNHLDIRFQHEALQRVSSLGRTSVVVLHDLNLAARYCQRLALMEEGKLVAVGEVDQVLRPEILEPVYRMEVHCTEIKGSLQLLMSPPEERTPPT